MRDHVQRKRHHAVSDVIQQVVAAEPVAFLWPGGLLEKDEKRTQVGAARRKVSDDGYRAEPPKQHLRGLGKIAIRQNVSWLSETPKIRGDGDQAAASGGSSTGKQMSQPNLEVNMKVTRAMPPTTQQPERTMELAKGPPVMGFGDESEPGHELKSKGGDPEQQTENDDQPPQQTVALLILNNTWTGSPPTVLNSRTRSGGDAAVRDGHEAALNVVIAKDGKREHETVVHESTTNLSAMKAVLVNPGGGMVTAYPPSLKATAKPWSCQNGNTEKRRRKQRWVAS